MRRRRRWRKRGRREGEREVEEKEKERRMRMGRIDIGMMMVKRRRKRKRSKKAILAKETMSEKVQTKGQRGKTQEKAAGKNHNNSRAVSPTRYLPMLKCHLPAADRTIVHSENRLSSNLSVALSI